MPYVELKGRNALALAAASVALGAVPVALLLLRCLAGGFTAPTVELAPGLKVPWASDLYLLASLAIAAALLPYAIVCHLNMRYVDAIEKALPAFLEGLEEGVRAGMPLVRALEVAALSLIHI